MVSLSSTVRTTTPEVPSRSYACGTCSTSPHVPAASSCHVTGRYCGAPGGYASSRYGYGYGAVPVPELEVVPEVEVVVVLVLGYEVESDLEEVEEEWEEVEEVEVEVELELELYCRISRMFAPTSTVQLTDRASASSGISPARIRRCRAEPFEPEFVPEFDPAPELATEFSPEISLNSSANFSDEFSLSASQLYTETSSVICTESCSTDT